MSAVMFQSSDVDSQHAVIDYSEVDCCFVLQDLNSSKGTFVNDCRVHNAAVRLASGDVIRFGALGPSYKFLTEAVSQVLRDSFLWHWQSALVYLLYLAEHRVTLLD